jgi:hypothetical protein
MDENTKLIHWTSGGPWFDQYKDCPHCEVWYAARDEWKARRQAQQHLNPPHILPLKTGIWLPETTAHA